MCYEERCPICNMPLRYCECANKSELSEDEEAAFQVALEHLYLLSEEQIRHLIEIERVWEIGYTDNREMFVESLKKEAEERERNISTEPPKPKPCPHCGTAAIPVDVTEYSVRMNCGCGFAWNATGWQNTEKDAIKVWNAIADELTKRKQNKEAELRNVTCLIAKTDGISDEEIKKLFTKGRFE